ncbi:uncharacterized protein LOC108107704 [Drosophila eugracilis]|uniref:uncharacterized protein LOC108107704 n=1 Tax=Drosophila eugracilis TaxID=29029 RepID=UPI0007E67E0A|nr:uncharacterized protein LOC108107704 [Drosophila eugracilis]
MNKIDDLLEQLQRQENDLKQFHLKEPASTPEEQLCQWELDKAQISHYNSLRNGILTNIEQEITNMGIARLRNQVNGFNRSLARMNEINNCSICKKICKPDDMHYLVSLRCGHLFGSLCIYSAIRDYFQCPVCRRSAYPSHVRRVYL